MNGALKCWWIALRSIHPTGDFSRAIITINVGWMERSAIHQTMGNVPRAIVSINVMCGTGIIFFRYHLDQRRVDEAERNPPAHTAPFILQSPLHLP